MDGCGVGAAPDYAQFGDFGVNRPDTLANIARAVGGLKVPNLRGLGLGQITNLYTGFREVAPLGSYGKLREISMGKDTVIGLWEMMGIATSTPFPTYPEGFPPEVVERFQEATGLEVIGNKPASGTEIIKELGVQHIRTGRPIVYTSADSVFQIAAHEELFGLARLYEICEVARSQLVAPHNVERVIARPFVGGAPGNFVRTKNRRDYPLQPPRNVIDALEEAGVCCHAIGVVGEVFAGRGFARSTRTQSNPEHQGALMDALGSDAKFVFADFEDFDMLYGHRNDPEGFARALEEFDEMLGITLGRMRRTDLLIITADHGNDPTTPSTDHDREYAPLLAYSPMMQVGLDLGTRGTFADIGATIAEVFGVEAPMGRSFLGDSGLRARAVKRNSA
jgi:phosphopentomutase